MKALAILALGALLAFQGCTTTTVSREGETMVDIENTGWYLFNFIPLASGDPSAPNHCRCRLFQRTVTLENNIRMLERIIREEGATGVKDLSSFTTDEHFFVMLLKRHAYHTSARLTKDCPEASTVQEEE